MPWSWFTFWLIVHILTVIIAFGPTFAFGLIGAPQPILRSSASRRL